MHEKFVYLHLVPTTYMPDSLFEADLSVVHVI
jgi:hypothetical protein